MFTRVATIPSYSFFLFGPRSTGKTTWLREKLPDALWINLLRDEELFQYAGDLSLFRRRVEAFAGRWVVVDEVQKLPSLLNEVHDLMTVSPQRHLFALSGSSARKLRRSGVNLLAGRVIEKRFFPLVRHEIGDAFDLNRALEVGTLPLVMTSPEFAEQILSAYVTTYLKEEIQQEALVEDIGSFHRFLAVTGQLNATIPNVSAIARDVGIARKTVERYFDTLVDTLIAYRLPAWQPRAKVRERARPKFYFFDCGVVRALQNRLGIPLLPEERGGLLETYLLHEIRTYLSLQKVPGLLSYWQSASGAEIDVILSKGDQHIGLEIKSASKWRREFGGALKEMKASGTLSRAIGIYCGEHKERDGDVEIIPVHHFLDELYSGKLSD